MPKTVTPPEYEHGYLSLPISGRIEQRRVMIGVPTLGLIRMEWALARWSQWIPTNWSSSDCIQWLSQVSPIGFSVADARNLIVHTALQHQFEWVLFSDSDTILPPDAFVRFNEYMREGTIPVVSGLYFTKSVPAEPLVYRGRGNSYFAKWKLGDKIWVDGVPMGATLINCALLRAMAAEAPDTLIQGQYKVKQIFDTPSVRWVDPEAGSIQTFQGTEDLAWCDRVMHGEFLKKAGWPKLAKRPFPFLIDSNIFCFHIDESGRKFPLEFHW